ncbi:MAG: TetR/AcrR family transcriptional regulator [Candidatus Geothermincolia bacterium]
MSARVKGHNETTRQQVIDAAIRKFGEKSFLGATTIEIADEAGVSEKTIFDLFGDKKTLYLEVREYIRRSAISEMLPRLPIGGGAPAILRALGREFLREVAGDRDKARVSIQAITAIDDPDIKKSTRDFFLETQKLVCNVLVEGQKTGLVRTDLNVEQFAWTYALALHSAGYVSLMAMLPTLDEGSALVFLNRLVDTIEPPAQAGALITSKKRSRA